MRAVLSTLALVVVLLPCPAPAASDPFPVGRSMADLEFESARIRIYTYKPQGYQGGPVLMVFHGVLRNAEEYRDHAMVLGDRFGALIVAPLFDVEQFPKAKYQFGGIVADGRAVPAQQRTGEFVNRIAREVRRREGNETLPYALIGHSGGGQFLGRLAAFVATDAQRIVISNPSSYTLPTVEAEFPYGLGGLPAELQSEDLCRAYLAQPVTIYVGSRDVVRDEYFDDSARADRQGSSRLDRGQRTYDYARQLARRRGWPFHWKLVVAEGVEHDHEKMFNHSACAEALGWKPVR